MIGQKLQDGRFEVLRQLADGWMGEEYVVYDENRDSTLALRVLDTLDEEVFSVLKHEHPTLVNFGHPCLFYIFELFEEEGHWFLVTDLVEGVVDFWDVKAGGELPSLDRVQNVCWQVVDALNFLHENGTCHGRLDGSNVIVLPGDEVRVAEFGLVGKGEGTGELADRVLKDWRDLGVLLYRVLTGRGASEKEGDSFLKVSILKQLAIGREVDESLAKELVDVCLELVQIQPGDAIDGASFLERLKPFVDTSDPVEEALLDQLSGKTGVLERAQVVESLVKHYTLKCRFDEAFELACLEVEALGVDIPRKFNGWRFRWVTLLNKMRLKRGHVEEVLRFSCMENEKLTAALRIMHSVLQAAFRIQHKLGWLLLLEAVLLCLRSGTSPDRLALFAIYGLIYRGGIKEEYGFGEEMRRVVSGLAKSNSDSRCLAEVEYLVGMHGTCWHYPAEEGEDCLQKAYETGRRSGDLYTARLAAIGLVMSQWMRGVRLQELWDLTERFHPFIEESELEELPAVLRMIRQVIRCYRGETPQVDYLDSDDFDEGQYLGDMVGFQYRHIAQFSYVFLANFCAAHGRLVASRIHAHLSRENIQEESSPGMLLYAEHFFQEVLSNGCDQEFGKVENFLPSALNQFQTWTSLCPGNFKAKQEMIFAEDYLKSGRPSDAQLCYLQAAETAVKYENSLVRAWAFERLVRLPDGEKFVKARMQAWRDYGALTLVNPKK